MKQMKRLFAIVLILSMLLVLAACGGSKTPSGGGAAAPGKSDSLPGNYTAVIDMSSMMDAEEYTFETPLNITLEMELKEDQSFSIGINVEQFLADVETFYRTEFPEVIKKAFTDRGYSEEELSSFLKEMGYDSIDAYLDDQIQASLETLRENYPTETGVHFYLEGTYKVEGDQIYFTGKEDQEAEVKEACKINQDGTITMTLKIADIDYDLTFSKQ